MAGNGSKSQLTRTEKTIKRQGDDDSDIQVDDISKILHRKLSDVGAYSYSALCAVSFLQLFEDEWHNEFKKTTLTKIVEHLHLPAQAKDSVIAIMEGQGFDDARPYVDTVLQEPVLEKSGVPIVTDLLSLAIYDGCYDSRMRVLIKHVAWQLRVSWDTLEEIEATMADTLESASNEQYEMSEEEMKEKKSQSRKAKAKRFALIGLATIGGGTLIGLTGGLAAPLVAAGAGAIIGGAGAAALGSTAGVAIIGSLFGVAGAGLTGYKMKKRVGAVEEFVFEPLVFGTRLKADPHPAKQLHITVAVSGWLSTSMEDFKLPWISLAESREQYSLRWESKYLIQLGRALDYILGGAMSVATQEALKYTVLSGILSAITWPSALVSIAGVIDNPWSVCIQRAGAVGKELAEVLLAREQGQRPVTLIGFSLGARVVFSCLEELCKRKGSEGIIEDAILLGAPVSGDPKIWSSLTRVVGGKIINGYCRGDWLLKFLFRTASVHLTTVAGLSPIKWDNRRMHNIDLSDVVGGHKDYLKQLDVIMKVVGIRTKGDIKLPTKSSEKPLPRTSSCDSFTSSEGEVDNSPDVFNQPDGQECLKREVTEESEPSFVVLADGENSINNHGNSSPSTSPKVIFSDQSDLSFVPIAEKTEELKTKHGSQSSLNGDQSDLSFVPITENAEKQDGQSVLETDRSDSNIVPTVQNAEHGDQAVLKTDQSDLSFVPTVQNTEHNDQPLLKTDQSDLSFVPIDDNSLIPETDSKPTIQPMLPPIQSDFKNLCIDNEKVIENSSHHIDQPLTTDQSDFSFVKISEDGNEDNTSAPLDLSNKTFKQYLGTVIDCDLEGD